MGTSRTIGGDRLGAGKKMKVDIHGYDRSTHNLGYIWRSTMAPGTLVPFMVMIALPGDTFDIDLNADVKTHPTVGPLFGSMKLQLDVFKCPIRLYQRSLHNNKLNVGLNMSEIKFPTMTLQAAMVTDQSDEPVDIQQINPSSILAYLGIRGVAGYDLGETFVTRNFNALGLLMYWDIFKNYYANKQEDKAFVIHATQPTITGADYLTSASEEVYPTPAVTLPITYTGLMTVTGTDMNKELIEFQMEETGTTWVKMSDIFYNIIGNPQYLVGSGAKEAYLGNTFAAARVNTTSTEYTPALTEFNLENLDQMREELLSTDDSVAVNLATLNGEEGIEPYSYAYSTDGSNRLFARHKQEGLAVKTYQSDIFNNWLNTEFIDGVNGIAAVTAIAIVDNQFTLDTLNVAKKVYDMLNRIAISGGTYKDYIETVYDHQSYWNAETPTYEGGLSKEIVFQEVVSTAEITGDNPLGSLAGKGTLSGKHKGGKITIKVDEPCYIMGIVSITPRVDYSQGNEWFVTLESLDDLHKPALDGIGYQDLICEQMAFWDTYIDGSDNLIQTSAGKVPAWMNYRTNFNKTYGNFADARNEMFMTLNRRYTRSLVTGRIDDLTTYIDPSKFNYMFAQTEISAQNFWVQISNDITARRKMSTSMIPNL